MYARILHSPGRLFAHACLRDGDAELGHTGGEHSISFECGGILLDVLVLILFRFSASFGM